MTDRSAAFWGLVSQSVKFGAGLNQILVKIGLAGLCLLLSLAWRDYSPIFYAIFRLF